MSTAIKVEIVGGPRDGAIFCLPDGIRELRYPLLMHPSINAETLTSYEASLEALDVREVRLPIVLTRNGYKAYWKEPSC
jgi:hypothetical protein